METIVRANDKLLKAFIALPMLKDEHRLSELRIMFAAVAVGASSGLQDDADEASAAHARRELNRIAEIVGRLEGARRPRAVRRTPIDAARMGVPVDWERFSVTSDFLCRAKPLRNRS